MARDPKIEVAALNIRIPSDRDRDYLDLLTKIAALKKGVRVYGDSYCAISSFNSDSMLGIISKYTEIDIDGDWFDIEDFDAATPEKVEDIVIPENLRPNHASFYFYLDTDLHTLVFETYSRSKSLSTKSFEKYFKEIIRSESISDDYGRIEADIIKSYSAVEKLLRLPELKELRLTIRRPNPDDIGDNLASIIEERLSEQGADEYEETLKAKGKNDLLPNERTKKLADLAADNGHVQARSIVNGVLTSQDTADSPLVEGKTYKAEDFDLNTFTSLARRILSRITSHRAP